MLEIESMLHITSIKVPCIINQYEVAVLSYSESIEWSTCTINYHEQYSAKVSTRGFVKDLSELFP